MKKAIIGFLLLACLSGCTTYNAHFANPGERINPYDQTPIPNDGLAGFARDVINR